MDYPYPELAQVAEPVLATNNSISTLFGPSGLVIHVVLGLRSILVAELSWP